MSAALAHVAAAAGFIVRPIQILPRTVDLRVGLDLPPDGTNRALAAARLLIRQRGVFHCRTIDGGMVNLDVRLFRHFLELATAYWIYPQIQRIISSSQRLRLNSIIMLFHQTRSLDHAQSLRHTMFVAEPRCARGTASKSPDILL